MSNDLHPIQDLHWRRELAEAMKVVRSYTHCILGRNGNSIGIATAVAFRLDQRLFLITAGHAITGEFKVSLFAGEGPVIQAKVLSHHFHPDSPDTEVHADVGFIEVENVPSLT